MERKSAMLGLDSPQQLDIVQVQAQKEPSQHDKIAKVINDFWNRMSEPEKELRNRLNRMTPEQALEVLDRLEQSDGNGAALSSPKPSDPKAN
jgi:division protein CdvB (Snf7/Vps24/ESCRT-III family)